MRCLNTTYAAAHTCSHVKSQRMAFSCQPLANITIPPVPSPPIRSSLPSVFLISCLSVFPFLFIPRLVFNLFSSLVFAFIFSLHLYLFLALLAGNYVSANRREKKKVLCPENTREQQASLQTCVLASLFR